MRTLMILIELVMTVESCHAFPDWPVNLFKKFALMWAVKELTIQDRISNTASYAWGFIRGGIEYMVLEIQHFTYQQYLSAQNILGIVVFIIGMVQLLLYIKGRHRTPNQSTEQANSQATTNEVHLHNTVQVGSDTRGPSIGNNQPAQAERYSEDIKLSTWLGRLEMFLMNNIQPSRWSEHTIMLLNNRLLEQIGELAPYLEEKEGYNKLKQALIGPLPIQVNKSFGLDELVQRRQGSQEDALSFGQAIKLLAYKIIESNNKLIELYCRGLRSADIRKEVAYFINDDSQQNSTID